MIPTCGKLSPGIAKVNTTAPNFGEIKHARTFIRIGKPAHKQCLMSNVGRCGFVVTQQEAKTETFDISGEK